MNYTLHNFGAPLLTLLAGLAFCWACIATWPAKARAEDTGGPAPVLAWIEIEPGAGPPDQIVVIGKAYGLKQSEGRFTLDVRRHERGNVSNSAQSGVFKVAPGENADLSRTSINVRPGSAVEILLKLNVGGREVYAATMTPAN